MNINYIQRFAIRAYHVIQGLFLGKAKDPTLVVEPILGIHRTSVPVDLLFGFEVVFFLSVPLWQPPDAAMKCDIGAAPIALLPTQV
ncbi:hypothetical protein OPV22_017479 [Ensete ventricosum]|uniref:Uncharacterized protein n=1 Tax=Ensete ventricosum TaxID=4639 RepID=A0AAV8R242_ENSVE|nr:hypothetical protein OPV22_017479 [Ensete ventricosum]